MADNIVPRRTVLGTALFAVAGLLQSKAALAGSPARATKNAHSTVGTKPVSSVEMREWVDKSAIVEMVSRLGKWLDLKQFDDPAVNEALFMPNIVVGTPGGAGARGIEAVVEKARKRHGSITCQHLHTNVLVDVHGDTASAEANLLVTFVPDPKKPAAFSQVGTRYRFELARVGQGWKFASINDHMLWHRDETSPPQAS